MPDLPSPLSHIPYGVGIHDMLNMKTGCISLAGSYYWSPGRFVWGWRASVIDRMSLRRSMRSTMLIESCGCLHFPIILQILNQNCSLLKIISKVASIFAPFASLGDCCSLVRYIALTFTVRTIFNVSPFPKMNWCSELPNASTPERSLADAVLGHLCRKQIRNGWCSNKV
jgi:hypothetical protein